MSHGTVFSNYLVLVANVEADAHGHNLGSHAAHGPESTFDQSVIQEAKEEKSPSAASDVEVAKDHHHHTHPYGIPDSLITQIIGVGILEFGVVLHR